MNDNACGMKRTLFVVTTCFWFAGMLLVAGAPSPAQSGASPVADSPSTTAAEYRAMLDRYCVTCHNSRLKTAELMLDSIDLNHVPDHAETWEKVIKKLRVSAMPPQGMPR